MYVDVHKIVTIFSFPVGRKHVIISQELNQRFRFNREKAAEKRKWRNLVMGIIKSEYLKKEFKSLAMISVGILLFSI